MAPSSAEGGGGWEEVAVVEVVAPLADAEAMVISEEAPPLAEVGYDGLLALELDRVLASMMAKRVDGRIRDARGAIVALRRVYQALADLAFHDMSTAEISGQGLAAARAAWAKKDGVTD